MSRDAELRGFLAGAGHAGAAVAALAGDASFRRYWRVTWPGGRAVLMDAPPGVEEVRPFLSVRDDLAGAGLSAPAVLAADLERGFVLLEDFGDRLYGTVLTTENCATLYDAAIDALAVLAGAGCAGRPGWGAAEMTRAAAASFLEWWWPATFGQPAGAAVAADFAAGMGEMLAVVEAQPKVLVHRDYFAGNLFWLEERRGVRRVGVIDFQDAAMGSAAYDLVSLVQDARRDLPEWLTERAIGRLLAARPDLEPAGFRAAFAVCAAQRHLRVAALWVRLDRRDGKPGYLRHGARCWALLERALAHPATAPLRAFLDAHVPVGLRGNPA